MIGITSMYYGRKQYSGGWEEGALTPSGVAETALFLLKLRFEE